MTVCSSATSKPSNRWHVGIKRRESVAAHFTGKASATLPPNAVNPFSLGKRRNLAASRVNNDP